jgi:hypothetical protein
MHSSSSSFNKDLRLFPYLFLLCVCVCFKKELEERRRRILLLLVPFAHILLAQSHWGSGGAGF